MCCVACTRSPIKPISERLMELDEVGCVCEGMTEEEAKHVILIGDRRLSRLLEDREWCIRQLGLEKIR